MSCIVGTNKGVIMEITLHTHKGIPVDFIEAISHLALIVDSNKDYEVSLIIKTKPKLIKIKTDKS